MSNFNLVRDSQLNNFIEKVEDVNHISRLNIGLSTKHYRYVAINQTVLASRNLRIVNLKEPSEAYFRLK